MHGHLALLLHAHLPFVRHPEHERFLEESWLFEAVADCYLPLIEVMQRWMDDGVAARLTFSISPTLLAMWEDPLLRDRCHRYLAGRVELAGREVERTLWLPEHRSLARFQASRFRKCGDLWNRLGGDLTRFFRQAQQAGLVDLITTSATHAVLPLLREDPGSMSAQVELACAGHERAFGRRPRGFWLPECAWAAEVSPCLRSAGIDWCVLETHGLLHARPRPSQAMLAPVRDRLGLCCFGRDHRTAAQVWSRKAGYPGDPRYRDFHRDAGWDLDLDYLRPFLPSPDHRGTTGLKYHRIGSDPGGQALYDPDAAEVAVAAQAAHLVESLKTRTAEVGARLDRDPIFVAPYDAELFGHWWFEGPAFLDAVVRRVATGGEGLSLTTPTDYLARHSRCEVVEPAASSWGEGGYFKVWLGSSNEWILPELRDAGLRMRQLARRFPQADGIRVRALRQAARELLLAQASDWPFMLHNRSSPHYAEARVRGHLAQFRQLADALEGLGIDQAWLGALEARDNLFPDIDWTMWA